MTGQRDVLLKTLEDKDKSIEQLTKENVELKERIRKMESIVSKNNIEISKLQTRLCEMETSRLLT